MSFCILLSTVALRFGLCVCVVCVYVCVCVCVCTVVEMKCKSNTTAISDATLFDFNTIRRDGVHITVYVIEIVCVAVVHQIVLHYSFTCEVVSTQY